MGIRRPFERAALGVAALLAVVASARGQVPVSGEWSALAPGLWYRAWSVKRSSEAGDALGHVFRADPKVVRVTMLDARRDERSVARVARLREEGGAYLAVNGGFFDPQNRALGLVVGDGRQQSSLRKVDQGVFFISGGRPRIQHTRDPLPDLLETALQAGPRLIVNGRSLSLKPQESRRTCLCLPGDGTVVIVVIPTAISLADLAASLGRPASTGGLGCWDALNLDGGPSTQLSLATPEMSLDVEGGWSVPNALAVLPR